MVMIDLWGHLTDPRRVPARSARLHKGCQAGSFLRLLRFLRISRGGCVSVLLGRIEGDREMVLSRRTLRGEDGRP